MEFSNTLLLMPAAALNETTTVNVNHTIMFEISFKQDIRPHMKTIMQPSYSYM